MPTENDDALTQEELDALDTEDSAQAGDDEEGDVPHGGQPGLDADRQEGEEGGEGGSEEEAAEARPVSRGQRSFGRLRSELREAREQNAKDRQEFQRQINELRYAQQQPQALTVQQEAERLAAMTPEERTDERLRRTEQNHQALMYQQQYLHADQMDRQAFEALSQKDGRAARYKDEVEQLLGAARQAGMNLKREVLYYYALGRKVAEARAKSSPKQRQDAQERVRRATTRPTNAGSDTQARARAKSLEQRLEGVPI